MADGTTNSVSTETTTADAIKRFGFGVLELTRSKEAEPGEVMASRATGLFGLKSEGTYQTISYEYMTRFRAVYNDFKSKMIASGTVGKIGKLDIADEPAVPMTNATVIQCPSLKITDTKTLSFIRFGLDLDVVDVISGIPISCNPTVEVTFTVAKNSDTNTSRTYTKALPLKDMNNQIFVPDYTGFETVSAAINHDFTFDSIKVTLPDSIKAEAVQIILHSLLVSFKEVG